MFQSTSQNVMAFNKKEMHRFILRINAATIDIATSTKQNQVIYNQLKMTNCQNTGISSK
jgi:hypothetical protein